MENTRDTKREYSKKEKGNNGSRVKEREGDAKGGRRRMRRKGEAMEGVEWKWVADAGPQVKEGVRLHGVRRATRNKSAADSEGGRALGRRCVRGA